MPDFVDIEEYNNFNHSVKETPSYRGTIYYRSSLKKKVFINFIQIQETVRKNIKLYLLSYLDGLGHLTKEEIYADKVDDIIFYDAYLQPLMYQTRFVVISSSFMFLFGFILGALIF